VAAIDGAGTVLWREDYLPFGATRQNPPSNTDDVGYTGHVQDAATGLTYMQARYYDPVVSRFLSPDPVGFSTARPEMFNRYAYVGNDPINATDPDGRVLRAIVSGAKIVRRTIKAHGNVNKAVRDEIADIMDTGATLADPSASGFEKLIAVGELASGIDLPGNNATREAPDALPINSRTHGGQDHNSRIAQVAANAQAAGATDIRKQRSQVNVDGSIVGNNKPGLQFDLDGKHVNFEVDRNAASSQRHLDQVSSNDPCSITICEEIKH
jgi:RHS repeat-associated protein